MRVCLKPYFSPQIPNDIRANGACHLHDDHENDELGLSHAKQYCADDGGEIQRHQDAVVVDQKRDDEFDETAKLFDRHERGANAAERQREIVFPGGQRLSLTAFAHPQKEGDGRQRKEQGGKDK